MLLFGKRITLYSNTIALNYLCTYQVLVYKYRLSFKFKPNRGSKYELRKIAIRKTS